MTSGLESLHKILKDEKRRKIVTLLNEKGSLTYTELMNTLEIDSTGKLNYHLKILGELLTKQEDGCYILTGKGKLAVQMLQELGERKSQSQIEAQTPRGYIIIVSLFSVAVIGVDFALFIQGSITRDLFAEYLLTAVLAFVFLVAAERARVKRSMWQPNRQMLGAKLSIIFAGAFGGGVILFFGGGLLIGLLGRIGVLTRFVSFDTWIVMSFVVGAVIGGFAGYLIFKNSKLSKTSYYDPF
jgi:hypothetical protein